MRNRKSTSLDDSLFRQAIEQSSNAVLINTADWEAPGPEIVFVNPAMCAQSGYRAEDLLGQTPRTLQGPAPDRGVLDRLRETILRGEFFEGQAINYRKDGSPSLRAVMYKQWGRCAKCRFSRSP